MAELLHNEDLPVYTLGITAKLSNTPQHSLRQYIDKGLIIPFKTKTKRHLFSDTDVKRLLWIRKQLDENGLNFAGIKALYALIPCWSIKSCKPEERKKCEAYYATDNPCWEASEKGIRCKNEDCRTCNVYRRSGPELEIKEVIKEFIP